MPHSDQLALDRVTRGLSPRLADIVLGSAVTLIVSLVITADVGGSGPDPAAYLWAVGLGALMLVRRRYPVLVVVLSVAGLIAYYTVNFPPIGVAVPVAAAVFSAAEVGRLVPAVLGAVVVLGVSTTYRLVSGQDPSFVLGYELVGHAMLLAAAVALGDGLRSRREAHDRAGEVAALMAERYRRETDARLTAELLAISRDLHDSLGHATAVVALHAQVATEAIGRDDAAARQALEIISTTTTAMIADLRRTVAVLRSSDHARREVVHLNDLDAAVRPARQAGIDVVTAVALPSGSLPAVVETAAYRIVQESIINVARHSAASHVRVEVDLRDGAVQVRVVDDGPPTVESNDGGRRPAGHGVIGMRERAEALGGTLTAGRTTGGFEVCACLPLAARS